jgi:acylphosphatase
VTRVRPLDDAGAGEPGERDLVRVRMIVRGRVQGVWFRGSAREQALRLGVLGWARNRGDGSVEIVAEGKRAAIDELTAWCRRGPPGARVASVECALEPRGESLASFHVRG